MLFPQTMHVEEVTVQAGSWEALMPPQGAQGAAADRPALKWVPEAALAAQGLTTGVRKVLKLAEGKR